LCVGVCVCVCVHRSQWAERGNPMCVCVCVCVCVHRSQWAKRGNPRQLQRTIRVVAATALVRCITRPPRERAGDHLAGSSPPPLLDEQVLRERSLRPRGRRIGRDGLLVHTAAIILRHLVPRVPDHEQQPAERGKRHHALHPRVRRRAQEAAVAVELPPPRAEPGTRICMCCVRARIPHSRLVRLRARRTRKRHPHRRTMAV